MCAGGREDALGREGGPGEGAWLEGGFEEAEGDVRAVGGGGDGLAFFAPLVEVGGAVQVEVVGAGDGVFFQVCLAGYGVEPEVEWLKDGAHAVVVLLADGVCFVVVTFGALHGDAEDGAGAVLDGGVQPGGAVEEVVAAGEEAGGAEVVCVQGVDFICGKHLAEDEGVAFVCVEAFNDPVPPVVEVFLAVAELVAEAVPVCVTPDVHEVACPAFTV
jgi:hypothetical protein